jgi:hypothetical protein
VPPPRTAYDDRAVPVGASVRWGEPIRDTPAGGAAPDPAPADPGREIALARQAIAAADEAATHAEELARRPALLPMWAPLGRAVAVYAGCGAAAGVLQFVILYLNRLVDTDPFAYFAWSCAGLPALAFFAGFLILRLFGQPKVGETPDLYARLGFLICFLVAVVAPCLLTIVPRLLL